MPGCHGGENLDIVSVFEAVGKHAKGELEDAGLQAIETVVLHRRKQLLAEPGVEVVGVAIQCFQRLLVLPALRFGIGRQQGDAAQVAQLREQVAMPIYAIGGLAAADVDDARRHGAQGVAAIRALWPQPLTA